MYQVVEKAVCTALICQHTFSDDLFYELCREISCVLSHIYQHLRQLGRRKMHINRMNTAQRSDVAENLLQ
jgi:hypothetical protein